MTGADLPLPAGETSLVIALLFLIFWARGGCGWEGKMGGRQRVEASGRRVEGPSTTAISAFLRECLLALESCSVAQSCLTVQPPWTAARQASLSVTISRSLRKLTSIELVMPSNHLALCCPLLLPPSIFNLHLSEMADK